MCLVLPLSLKLFHFVVQNSSNIVLFCYALEFQVILLRYAKSIKHCLVLPSSFHVFWGFFVQNSSKTFLCAIFQPKGADRKHKTDREKMDKRTEAEKVNCNICNICNNCSLYPNKKLIDVIHWYANIIGSDVFFLYFGSINVRCVIQIHLSIFFLLLGKIPAIIWMYSFDRGDLDFSSFFCVVKNLEYCYHCFIDIHWHQFWWIQKYCWSTFIRWVKISMFLNHIQFSWDLISLYRNL